MSDWSISPETKLGIRVMLVVCAFGIFTGICIAVNGYMNSKNSETVSRKEEQSTVTSDAEVYTKYDGDVYYYVDEDNKVHVLA